jgi:hypothetical protein
MESAAPSAATYVRMRLKFDQMHQRNPHSYAFATWVPFSIAATHSRQPALS